MTTLAITFDGIQFTLTDTADGVRLIGPDGTAYQADDIAVPASPSPFPGLFQDIPAARAFDVVRYRDPRDVTKEEFDLTVRFGA